MTDSRLAYIFLMKDGEHMTPVVGDLVSPNHWVAGDLVSPSQWELLRGPRPGMSVNDLNDLGEPTSPVCEVGMGRCRIMAASRS